MNVSTLISRAQTAILVLADPSLPAIERADLMVKLAKMQKSLRLEYVTVSARLSGMRDIVTAGHIPTALQEAGFTLASIREDMPALKETAADLSHLLNRIGLILTFAQ